MTKIGWKKACVPTYKRQATRKSNTTGNVKWDLLALNKDLRYYTTAGSKVYADDCGLVYFEKRCSSVVHPTYPSPKLLNGEKL